MLLDEVTTFLLHVGYQFLHCLLIPTKELHLTAFLAYQQVLVPGKGSHETLTARWLVDTLEQTQLF